MNQQEKYFFDKFSECSKVLCAKPKELISLKYRHFRDNYYYKELIHTLENIKGINVENIGSSMGGNAYVLSIGTQRIVIVEHETGLEILYVAGSIASLISLVLQISTMISNHGHMRDFAPHAPEGAEIRYYDKKGEFIEEHKPVYLPHEMFLQFTNNDEYSVLKNRIEVLEKKLNKLARRKQVSTKGKITKANKRRK